MTTRVLHERVKPPHVDDAIYDYECPRTCGKGNVRPCAYHATFGASIVRRVRKRDVFATNVQCKHPRNDAWPTCSACACKHVCAASNNIVLVGVDPDAPYRDLALLDRYLVHENSVVPRRWFLRRCVYSIMWRNIHGGTQDRYDLIVGVEPSAMPAILRWMRAHHESTKFVQWIGEYRRRHAYDYDRERATNVAPIERAAL